MRRTIVSTICIAGAFVLATSCNKAEDNPTASERTVITAVAEAIGGDTKAHNQYCYDVLWDEGDQIYVTGGGKSNTFTVSDESAGTSKGKFTEDTPSYGITGNIEAFYPASLKTADGYVWPATQSNNQAPPMYAKQSITGADAETVNFSSLGAMLQIVFNTTVPNIVLKSIEIKDGTKPLSGKFTVDTEGKAVISSGNAAAITLDLGENGKILGKGANYFYIAIPAGKYEDLTLTFTDTDKGTFVMTGGNLDIQHNTVGRLTLTGTKYHFHTLPGVFTVSPGADGTEGTADDVKVHFSPGNLRYTIASQKWSFFPSQYDCGPATYADGHDKEISLFTWGYGWWSIIPDTKETLTFATEPGKSQKNFATSDDWGGRLQDERTWRTLTLDEWEYIIKGRTDYKNKMAHATVCGVHGLIILPDSFEDPCTNVGQKAFVPLAEETNLGDNDVYKNNIYASVCDWTAMELAGAVFLPLTGMRTGDKIEWYAESGDYWTSTTQQVVEDNPFRPTRLHFNEGNPFMIIDSDNYAFAVRLVTDVK